MKVLVAGATGAIGRRLVPRLVAAGHEVTGLGRSDPGLQHLRDSGARAEACDVFDAEAVQEVFAAVRPEVVVDELTSLPASIDPRRIEEIYAANNRARLEGGGNVLGAAVATGARRVVQQSVAFWYRPDGPEPKTEDEPLFLDAPEPMGEGARVMHAVEQRALSSGLEAVVLRYGMFYGPGTWYSADGEAARRVRSRMFPVVGAGDQTYCFVHIDDAATATVLALDGAPGTYNVVDDVPARMADWLPAFARALGAKPPLRAPKVAARLAAGSATIAWMDNLRAVDNSRIKKILGWSPRYPSYREGFATGLF